MKFIFAFSVIISIIFGFFTNKTQEVTKALMTQSQNAVELSITLMGAMAFWGGIMKIAEKSGFTDVVAKLFRPLAKRLFKGLNLEGKAFKAIVMNLTANLLGLGNAATPLGIQAVKELAREEKSNGFATENMVIFIVMNTASIQLLPITVATLRLAHGAKNPFDILPAVLISSFCSAAVGILMAKALCSGRNLNKYAKRKLLNENK